MRYLLGGTIMETRFSATKTPDRKKRRHPLSPIIKRSINIAGHDTSVTLEAEFWNALQDIAKSKNVSVPVLIDQIDHDRMGGNLSSSVRLFVLEYFKALS
jgi:predicted DNA-binding ribbon-helix-helix protein